MSSGPYTPRQFIEDASALLEPGRTPAALRQLGDQLRRLARELDLDSAQLAGLHGSSAGARILEEGAGGIALMLAYFPSDVSTPIHNHNSWGIACVVKGRDRYTWWIRLDDGSNPGRAELHRAEERYLEPGDVVYFDEPPGDIHSQQGVGNGAWELVFFGRNPNLQPRAYFDPKTGAVTYASATQTTQTG